MGLFNFNRSKNQPNHQSSTAETSSAWDTLRSQSDHTELISDTERAQAEQLAANKARQERKAIGMILYGENAITQPDLQITDQDRERAYQMLSDGSFGPKEQSAILQRIAPPSRAHGGTPQAVFAKLSDKHSRRIFAFVNGIPDIPENLRDMPSTMVDATLNRYPTPVEFNIKADEMLERLRLHNPESKCLEYARDLETFKQQLYGKRQEYYAAFQALQSQADERQTKQASRDRVLQAIHQSASTAPSGQTINSGKGSAQPTYAEPSAEQFAYPEEDLGYQAPEARERWRLSGPDTPRGDQSVRQSSQLERHSSLERQPVPPKPVEVYSINPKEAERYLREGRIEGDPFVQNGQTYQLTPEYLKDAGLGPEFIFDLGDQAKIALSRVYEAEGRDAVTAYVRTAQGTQIVSYYRSNSQGSWRYLPDYVSPDSSDGSSIEWFGKGVDEESLNLPATTQQALEIINAQPHLQNSQLHATFAFAGTAKRYKSKNDYREAKYNHALRGRHYEEVAWTPDLSLGSISDSKQTPETLDITDAKIKPDFDQPTLTYNFQSKIYGPVTSEHYRSGSGKLIWAFNRDASGRAWVGGIEIESPISSAGLRTQWAQAGDYGTPLYEYASMASGYGDPADRKGRSYISMWKYYLSRMPIIQKYLAHKNRTGE